MSDDVMATGVRAALHLRAERRRAAVGRWLAEMEGGQLLRFEVLDRSMLGAGARWSLAIADLLDALAGYRTGPRR